MHYHCSKLYTVYRRDIIQVVVWSRVSCTTTVQNYTLSTIATLFRWLFGAMLVALPCSKLYTVYMRDIIQLVAWSGVSCTTTFQNYTLSTSATLYRWLSGAVLVALPLFKTIHCLPARHYTCGSFGAVLVALPLFKTVHHLQAGHYTGGCLEPC